jgi:predicted DNA-binding protein
MVRTQIQLTEEQMKSLRRLAAATGRSIADLIRQSVEQYVAAQFGISREERIQRAIRATGRFSSGKSDISKEHDRYLAEAFRE